MSKYEVRQRRAQSVQRFAYGLTALIAGSVLLYIAASWGNSIMHEKANAMKQVGASFWEIWFNAELLLKTGLLWVVGAVLALIGSAMTAGQILTAILVRSGGRG